MQNVWFEKLNMATVLLFLMLAICSLCKNYIVKAIREQQTVTVSALPEIILTPAEGDTPDVSFHTITMISAIIGVACAADLI